MSEAVARVLVVEDTPTQAQLARALLVGLGHQVEVAESAGAALVAAREWKPDAILLDIELPDYNGMELMQRMRAEGIAASVIVVTANASINAAVEAMRAGAVDFIVKPYAKARLSVTLANALEKRSLAAQLATVKARLDRDQFFGFIGGSAPMQAAYRTIESVAASKASVFITGESGTGKELAAEAVHRASPRVGRNFVALNCGAIPRDLLESEVFGHVRGAFTGASADREGAAKLADGGTLFLDEIGEMPLEMQVKLLRFVQTGTFSPVGSSRVEKVDVRFVCATNRDPMLEVQAGRFREDLYYRLYVVPVELPPLRARGEDVLMIARHFLAQFAREERRGFQGFSQAAEQALVQYPWPGNVRQLQNVVRNIVVLHDADRVELDMIPRTVRRGAADEEKARGDLAFAEAGRAEVGRVDGARSEPGRAELARSEVSRSEVSRAGFALPDLGHADLGRADFGRAEPLAASRVVRPAPAAGEVDVAEIVPLAVMERRLILAALRQTGQDVPRAAALLEINPSTIYRKLQTWRADGKLPPG